MREGKFALELPLCGTAESDSIVLSLRCWCRQFGVWFKPSVSIGIWQPQSLRATDVAQEKISAHYLPFSKVPEMVKWKTNQMIVQHKLQLWWSKVIKEWHSQRREGSEKDDKPTQASIMIVQSEVKRTKKWKMMMGQPSEFSLESVRQLMLASGGRWANKSLSNLKFVK